MELKCTLCNELKDETSFYKNKLMSSGYANQCKECVKIRSQKRHSVLSENIQWVEKERIRGREKFQRLYKNNDLIKNSRLFAKTPIFKGLRKYLKPKIQLERNQELHHWNYNYPKSFYILNIRFHKKIHKVLKFDESTMCFFYNDVILDTIEKHTTFLKEKSKELNLNIDIIIFELK